uniref:Uncharacterized protein n=1 Tax=Plectus sambesii TaxID=2011161 RepID=A0A914UKR8_9BILA
MVARNHLLLTVFATCAWVVVGQQCPSKVNDAIQRCVLPVAQYAKVLNAAGHKSTEGEQKSELGQAISLPNLGGDVFRELC